MAVVVEQNVFRLEIAVNDVKGMQVIEGERHLCRIKFGDWIREPLTNWINGWEGDNTGGTDIRPPQEGEEFPSGYIVHYHVEIGVILESAPEVYDKGMLNGFQDCLFIVCVLDLLCLDNLFFAQDFDGVKAKVVLAAYCGVTEREKGRSNDVERETKNGPKCTRPKLPVPKVLCMRKSASL